MDAQDAVVSEQSKPAGLAVSQPHQQSREQVGVSLSSDRKHHQPEQQTKKNQDDKTDRPDQSLQHSQQQQDRKQPLQQKPDTSSSASSLPPSKDRPAKEDRPEPALNLRNNDSSEDRDSDAETIVLPGKDGHSPSKVRKVRQEDRSDGDGDGDAPGHGLGPKLNQPAKPLAPISDHRPTTAATGNHTDDDVPRKKHLASNTGDKDRQPRRKEISSGLSSAPASPPPHQDRPSQHPHHHHPHPRRSDGTRSSVSDSEHSNPKSSHRSTLGDKARHGERLLSHKRKAPRAESDDEADSRKIRRQRTTSAGPDGPRIHKEFKNTQKHHPDNRDRSTSPPQPRQHRRSISHQLPQQSSQLPNGLILKKKKLPPPLLPPDDHSDESSTSGSPHPRSSKLRSLATPATTDSNVSPAKMAPHKKHLDAHGQTLLARACARGEYDGAKQRLGERPEDLNVADYAGNTPLQIAAINGCEDIVKLLIDAGCNLDCVNYDKDTPLLDAVDNGHLGVIKLLLDAGVNPRKANVNGEEPIDRVTDEDENAAEIRDLLTEARKRAGERRRTSEDRQSHQDYHEARDSNAPDSPRQSPVTAGPGASARRPGTVRSTKTRNDLLYMPLDDKTLRQAAGRGDEETVARILQVKEGYDDPEAMVAAARGGHDLVIQLLLGLGSANPDPAPVPSLQPEFATPVLAAIGQENIKVVELLLEQQGFDPTRRFKGETYYEIARRRQGTNWKDEEHKLKNAYDEYKRSHKDGLKKSPTRRDREREREEKRSRREEAREEAKISRRNLSSPTREGEPRKKANPSRVASPRESKRPEPTGDDQSQKRGPGRPKRDDKVPSINVSDREASPTLSHKTLKTKRTESDLAALSSEGETPKPRRKLVSKGELRGEREKQRRASMASNTSSLKEPTSPREPRNEDGPDKHKLSEKYHDRTKALKRDSSRDRLSVSGEGSAKRHRLSVTPDRSHNGDKDDGESQVKRRRLDADGNEKHAKRNASADGRIKQKAQSRDGSAKPANKSSHKDSSKHRDDDTSDAKESRDPNRRESGRSSVSDRSIHVKSEDMDVDMPDVIHAREADEHNARLAQEAAEEELARKKKKKQQQQAEELEAKKKKQQAEEAEARQKKEKEEQEQEEAKKREQEKKRKEEEEKRRRAAAEAKQEEERKLEAEKRRKEAEEEARRLEEEEAKRKKELARQQKEAEERRIREQAERERREAEEAARRQQEEEKKREEDEARKREEEERRQQQEEERLHQEQLEREAAAEAKKQREEEERRERERRERAHREEMEKKRAAREAEQRRIREEQKRARLEKLPPLLRWLELCPYPDTSELDRAFWRIQGVRFDTICPQANNTPEGREQWVLNTDVALLFGEKDLDLSRYTAWERVPAPLAAKKTLWLTEHIRYALTSLTFDNLRRSLPESYGGLELQHLTPEQKEQLRQEACQQFYKLDMFFVKVSDLLYTVPNIPHLRNVRLVINYKEVAETEAQYDATSPSKYLRKYKQDPNMEKYMGFAPREKVYVNGALLYENLPTRGRMSKTPFPEKRVPRRGLVQVFPEDPDYVQLCKEQGLEHLIAEASPMPMVNGGSVSPTSISAPNPMVNGASTNGNSNHDAHAHIESAPVANGGISNGISNASS